MHQFGQAASFHIDHIMPRSKNGPTSIDNLATQCPSCSLRKSDKTEWPDPETGTSTRLFHPLRDGWEDHFAHRRNMRRAHSDWTSDSRGAPDERCDAENGSCAAD